VRAGLNFLGENDTEDTVVYPVGRHIGLKSIKTGQMRFIEMKEEIREINKI
jgi:hypothetical protein